MKPLISGVHALIYSQDAAADRAFFRDVLGLDSVDSGGGWLIFALPPSELAIHPTDERGRSRALPTMREHRGDRHGAGTTGRPPHQAVQ